MLKQLATQINITVIKTELLKNPKNILSKNALNLLDALREELTALYSGLTVTPIIKGYWVDTSNKTHAWVNGHCANIESDIGEIWTIYTDLDLLAVENKVIASKTANLIDCVKMVTHQKSQLITINRNIEIIFS
jgi:hypothetical protein